MHRIARSRTQSQTYVTNLTESPGTSNASTALPPPPLPPPLVSTSLIISPSIHPTSNIVIQSHQQQQQQNEPEPSQSQPNLSSTALSNMTIVGSSTITNNGNIQISDSTTATNLLKQIQQTSSSPTTASSLLPLITTPQSATPAPSASSSLSNLNSSSLIDKNTTISTTEKRRPLKNSGKKNKKNRAGNQITTKDLGRWKPIDDLALIIGIQQTNDLRLVHLGTKFSCKFTVQEMQSRWYSLLYEEPISRIAVAAMRNLHPELVESIQSKALFSIQEEELLGSIKSVCNNVTNS